MGCVRAAKRAADSVAWYYAAMTSSSLWLPEFSDANRAITSASLDEGLGDVDRVELYISGFAGPAFDVPSELGTKLLAECGLVDECERRRTVPMVVAQLLADGRLGRVSDDEIAFLARHARVEPGMGLDDLRNMLLLRRASSSGSDADRALLVESLRRQTTEYGS